MARNSVVVQGADELLKILKGLPKKVVGKVMRPALRNGTKIFHAEIYRRAPVDEGDLQRALAVRAMKRKRGRIGYQVTMKNADKLATTTKSGARHFYPAVLEYGDSNREAQPFMRPGYDAKEDEVIRSVSNEVKDGIEKAARA